MTTSEAHNLKRCIAVVVYFMKYHSQFTNSQGDEFTVSSMEDYATTPLDIADFSKVLNDEPVRKYITDEAMAKWGHATTEELSKDILSHSKERWQDGAELRFLVRDAERRAVGMVGATMKGKMKGELWYYKISTVPPFMHDALVLVLPFFKCEGVRGLTATFDLGNHRSEKILSKLGFQRSSKPGEMVINL